MARIADDEDFKKLTDLIDKKDGWTLELSKGDTKVWTMPVEDCNFNMIKIQSLFDTVDGYTLFDVLLDPTYRKIWDSHMLDSHEIGVFNVNNDVGYYASKLTELPDFIKLFDSSIFFEKYIFSVMSSTTETS